MLVHPGVIATVFLMLVLSSCGPASHQEASAPGAPTQEMIDRETGETAAAVDTSAGAAIGLVQGQELYVPAYSHIYTLKRRPINLAVMLSVRNTDAQRAIEITAARYYDSHGSLVDAFVDKSLRLPPMASTDFFIDQTHTSGGSGANFIVAWQAAVPVSEPVVEAIMISTSSAQGISFTSPARVLKQW